MLTFEQMAEAYRGGMSCTDIADCVGHVSKEQVRKRLAAIGVERRGFGPVPNEKLREYVSQLMDTGMDFTKIAKQAGCSQSLVTKVARLKGW